MESRNRACKILEMETATRFEISPSRPNIRLGVVPPPKDQPMQCLNWIVDEVRDKGQTMAPILVYCRTLPAVAKVYAYLKAELGEDAWINRDPDQKAESQLIGIYQAKTWAHNKKRVVDSLNGQGNCRVAVCTTALGLGLNFRDVRHVVMYGVPQDIESVVQQVGRAGRNGLQAHAVLYNVKGAGKADQDVRDVVQMAKTSCFRKALFAKFEQNTASLQPGHICCTSCHKQCSCNGSGCAVTVPSYEVVKSVPVFDISKIQSPYPKDSISQTDMYYLDHFDDADDNPDSESDNNYDD